MRTPLSWLLLGTLSAWLLLVLPARFLMGTSVVITSGSAMLICLLASALALVVGLKLVRRSETGPLAAMVSGMGIRLVAVFGGGVALYKSVAELQTPAFWISLIVFYMVTLGLEVWLLLTAQSLEPARNA